MIDNFNKVLPSFCGIFVLRLITSIETGNVRFSMKQFLFSMRGMISVTLILVAAIYQQILSSTEQGFIERKLNNHVLILGDGHAISILA